MIKLRIWAPLPYSCTMHESKEQACLHFLDVLEDYMADLPDLYWEKWGINEVMDAHTMYDMGKIDAIRQNYEARKKSKDKKL